MQGHGAYFERYGILPVWGPEEVIYVDGTYAGNDSDGTLAKPYPTVQQGYQAANLGNTVRIRDGQYAEAPSMGKWVYLESYDGEAAVGP